MENKDALIQLQERVEQLLEESQDWQYTQYLRNLQKRIQGEMQNVNSLYREFHKNYVIYQNRMQNMGQVSMQTESSLQKEAPIQSGYIASQITPVQPAVWPVEKKSSMEFKVGAWLFSIIGVLFILAAFVILGMTYMNGMIKGMGLYMISLVILLVSEIILARKMHKFSLCITGLGICSLYLSTIINYLYLQNFNGIVALILTLMVTVAAIFISKKKDSAVIKIISFIGCYISLFPVRGFIDDVSFLTIAGILLIVNIVTVFLPVKRVQYGVNMTHMISNVIFTVILLEAGRHSDISTFCLFLFSICSIWIQDVIFTMQDRQIRQMDNRQKARNYQIGNIWAYCIGLFLVYVYCMNLSEYAVIPIAIISLVVFVIQKSGNIKWIQYWALNLFVFLTYVIFGDNAYEAVIGMLALFICAKLLGRISILKASELVITIFAAIQGLYYFIDTRTEGFFFVAAFLISVLFLYHFKSLYECMITFMLCSFAIAYLPVDIWLPVCVGILLLGILGFANVKFFKGRDNHIYNILCLSAMIFLYWLAVWNQNIIIYVCLLIFGITTIVVTFQKKYGMNFKGKALILSLFLTYMALVFPLDIPIAISILLMLVAIGSVISGFVQKKKEQRIYGLILTLFVCLKIPLFDFYGIETIQKMLLFLIVGVCILAISGIYILLEKKLNE